MATCVPGGGDESLKELERAVIINSSHHGHYPDEDAARPFFKLVTDLDIPVFIHPGDATTPAISRPFVGLGRVGGAPNDGGERVSPIRDFQPLSEIRDVYSRITGKIIADLEQGIRPWHRPWNADHAAGRITRPLRHNGIPYKLTTGTTDPQLMKRC